MTVIRKGGTYRLTTFNGVVIVIVVTRATGERVWYGTPRAVRQSLVTQTMRKTRSTDSVERAFFDAHAVEGILP